MADLTTIEEKLGEVTGLAAAAVDATKKVEGMLDDDKRTYENRIISFFLLNLPP